MGKVEYYIEIPEDYWVCSHNVEYVYSDENELN